MKSYKDVALQYAEDVAAGRVICGKEIRLACERFRRDLKRDDLELREHDPDFVIGIIEKLMVHRKGETLAGEPLTNKPVRLEPWQVFIVYNLLGFYVKKTGETRFKEAFIFLPRKNGKTMFISCLAFGVALLRRESGSTIYIVAAALKQAKEAFDDIRYSLKYRKMENEFRVLNNNAEHSVHKEFLDADGRPNGFVHVEALASNPDAQDSFNCNVAILDEVQAFKKAAQYNRFKEAMKSYNNRLLLAITTAGDNVNSFCYRRMEYAVKVVGGVVDDDTLFAFVARADTDDKGECDYTDPVQHQKANPMYGITIRPEEMRAAALQAKEDPQQRKDFLSRSLNVYTSAVKAWFDLEEFKRSDGQYTWTMEQLAKLPIDWFGGADLSRMHDLTAACLYCCYNGIDICVTHGFFPVAQAARKQDEDGIPLFQWLDDGWLTMCNSPTVNMADVVNWFKEMRSRGFKIASVGHDRKFAGEEYFPEMRKAGFSVVDQPQYFYVKSQGFRHIEKAAKDGRLFYCHSEAYEYCVSNVAGLEKTDDAVQYQKKDENARIDLFDASVFACIRMMAATAKKKKARAWWGEE